MNLIALAPWSGVVAIWLVIRYLTRRDERSRIGALTRDAPGAEPQTLIVPPCGCINTFTRTDIIRCPRCQARHDAGQAAARDQWAAEWNERLRRP